jgi:alpha-methylacyl-CoA racemase
VPVDQPAPQDNSTDSLPLAGLSVIELHAIGPVPFAGMLLGNLGATVTRVSPPTDPRLGVAGDPRFDLLNAGKRRLLVDLKDAGGAATLAAELDTADVLVEGFRPGVLERLGLAPGKLLEQHPRLVIGRLSGWGDNGPLAATAGHDINYLAIAGVLDAVGPAERPIPPLNLIADFGGGAMHLVAGVLARLVRRGVDGRGGLVTASIVAGTIGLTPMIYGMLASGRWQTGRENNLLDGRAPFYRTYRCGDGRFVAVGPLEPKFYRKLVELAGLSDRIDCARQYDESTWPEVTRIFAERFAGRSRDEWAQATADSDACLSPVLDFLEASAHPHNRANGWFDDDAGFAAPRSVLRFGVG